MKRLIRPHTKMRARLGATASTQEQPWHERTERWTDATRSDTLAARFSVVVDSGSRLASGSCDDPNRRCTPDLIARLRPRKSRSRRQGDPKRVSPLHRDRAAGRGRYLDECRTTHRGGRAELIFDALELRLSLSILRRMERQGGAKPPEPRPDLPRIDVLALLQGSKEAVLVFKGSEYRLRITRQGKLLLTK